MSHNTEITDNQIHYYIFEIDELDQQNRPEVHLPTYRGEKIGAKIEEMKKWGYSIKSVTPIHQGAFSYIPSIAAGGSSPTCGIVVHWEQTCCGARRVYDSILMTQDENRKNSEQWKGWAQAYRFCGDLKNATAILKTACLRFPDDAGLVYNLACYLCMQENFVSAKDCLYKAIEMDNKYEDFSKNDMDLFPLFAGHNNI